MDTLPIRLALGLETHRRQHQAFERLFQERRQQFLRLLRRAPSVADGWHKLAADRTYEAVIPPEVWKQLQQGRAQWDRKQSGLLGAVIRDRETGKVICHINLREVCPELLSSVNQLAAQQSLAEILERLESLERKIDTVLDGLQDDRIAIVESGADLYEQALAMNDRQTRRDYLLLAGQQLTEGRRLLRRSLESSLQFVDQLPKEPWRMMLWSVKGSNLTRIMHEVS
jgi:hypothetical protein